MKVKCNKCGHVGEESEFPKGHDFFQHSYIAACPKCDNRQSPGDASMRMFGGERPFSAVNDEPLPKTGDAKADAYIETMRRAKSVS